MSYESPSLAPVRTIVNGYAGAVGDPEVQIAAANPRRVGFIVIATGAAPVRVGAQGVTAATGLHMETHAGNHDRLELYGDACPTSAIYAIRQTVADGAVCCIEIIAGE